MAASFRTLRDCFYCSARRVSCQCSPAIRRRALVDMEHAQPLVTATELQRCDSDEGSLRRWAEGHHLRRTGTFSSQAALTYYSSDKTVPVTNTTIALYWTVGRLSSRRAAGLQAGLAAQLQPPRARIRTPSLPPDRERVAAQPPPLVDAGTDGCGADASSRPARVSAAGRTRRRAVAAAGEALPVHPAGAHVDANGVRRRRRRRGGHHALYFEAAVLGGIQALDGGYVRRGVRTGTVATTAGRGVAQQVRLSGSTCSSGRSEQSDTGATAGPRRPPPVQRPDSDTPSTASASLRLSAEQQRAPARAPAAVQRDPVSCSSARDGDGASTETNGGGACTSGGDSGGGEDDRAAPPDTSVPDSGVASAGAKKTTLQSRTVVSDSTWDGSPSPLPAPLVPWEPTEGVPGVVPDVAAAEDDDPFPSQAAIPAYDLDGVAGVGCWEDMFVPSLWTEPVEELDGCGEGAVAAAAALEPTTAFLGG